MDNLGSQVCQKMRSAVKAKLIELGTGGAAGYIDDELPDYVMIMVANKRSKTQMVSDLSLFLGTHTELFVTWLHEVLQKLQEVTLPATVITKTKRKPSEFEGAPSTKKEKKEKKKEKRQKRINEKPTEEVTPASISDVFADHLLEKTKKPLDIEIKGKREQSPTNRNSTDDFDIPTITEISEQNTEQNSREKDLRELAEIQRKIYHAKRHLKGLETEESEDEDFLNIKEDAEEFEDVDHEKNNRKNRSKSPITFDSNRDDDRMEEDLQTSPEKYRRHKPIIFTDDRGKEIVSETEATQRRKPIHERLGLKPSKTNENVISLSKHRRSEKEMYIPSFRRKEIEKDNNNIKRHDKKMESESNDDTDRNKIEKLTIRKRIGSRVIVAPPKPEYNEEDEIDKPVSSLIKIKPRPVISPSKQASKNLLLRAVAEAQKSTALVKPRREFAKSSSPNQLNNSRIQKLYTKSYRDRNRKALITRSTKDHIVIEVNAEKRSSSTLKRLEEDEYIPEPLSDRADSDNDFIYIPQAINSGKSDDEYDSVGDHDLDANRNKTQFVVTLDDKSRDKYITKNKLRIVEKSASGIEVKMLPENNKHTNNSPGEKEKTRISKHLSSIIKKSKESTKKLIIKNDSGDESSSPIKEKQQEKSTTPPLPKLPATPKRKRSTVSPIKFDLNDEQSHKRRSKSDEGESKAMLEQEKENDKTRISTKKSDSLKKYDNIPEFLSAVPLDSTAIKNNKAKERCKYFPTCGKGDSCEFYHPTLPCKAFPNCKFAEKCLYIHPKCKFDLTCNRTACNFSHTVAAPSSAPPLSSHVVPVQNYKTITATTLPALCKYYPNCTNTLCNFYHPKPCRFGKNCLNKIECNFYHHDLPNKAKFKWVASLG